MVARPAVATATQRRHGPILTPQDIRALSVARGYRWCLCCGSWYHESAEGRHGTFTCKRRRRHDNSE